MNERHSQTANDARIAGSIHRHLIVSFVAIAVLLGGGGLWATLSEISGAVVAPGTLVVESTVKQVQHREGGIVGEIRVRNGDAVAAGDLLIRLDDTGPRTNLAIIEKQIAELAAREARLVAERDSAGTIAFATADETAPDERAAARAAIETGQRQLMQARRNGLAGRRQQIEEQILQMHNRIVGLEAQRTAKSEEIALIDDELSRLQPLFEKQLITRRRLSELKRDRARLAGDRADLVADIAETQKTISERRQQMLQLDEDRRAEILEALQEVRTRITGLEEERIAARDEVARLAIRAPRAGIVHELAVHTIGGVIHPGETVLQIVPHEDLLVVEARVTPADIERLATERVAKIRFPGLDRRTTPELAARIMTVAADRTIDETTNTPYYAVRLAIMDSELARLGDLRLIAGMPVEAFVETGRRSVLSYLVKPIADQIAHAMREA